MFSHVLNFLFLLEFSGLYYCLFVKVLFVVVAWRNSDIISCVFPSVNTFFWSFFNFFHHRIFRWVFIISSPFFFVNWFLKLFICWLYLYYRRKKGISNQLRFFLSIDMKRRKRDLNPRAAWTTYTLSRGASSASWVFLLDSELYPLPIV